MMDHVALASRNAFDQLIRYCYSLGARWMGGPPPEELGGFYFCQAEFDGGTKLEFLEPIAGQFLHPKQSHGIVIQLAWHGGDEDGWPDVAELPPPKRPNRPALRAVRHLGRPGRLHHLELAVDEPGAVAGARPLGAGRYEIPPEHNLGTRLVLVAGEDAV
jgi:hypothetical protein